MNAAVLSIGLDVRQRLAAPPPMPTAAPFVRLSIGLFPALDSYDQAVERAAVKRASEKGAILPVVRETQLVREDPERPISLMGMREAITHLAMRMRAFTPASPTDRQSQR